MHYTTDLCCERESFHLRSSVVQYANKRRLIFVIVYIQSSSNYCCSKHSVCVDLCTIMLCYGLNVD